MAVYRSTYKQAQNSPRAMQTLYKFAATEAGQLRVDSWIREQGLYGKVRIGVIAMWNDGDTSRLLAHAKVIVPSKGTFEHEELYITFPSDHFKAKVMLVAG